MIDVYMHHKLSVIGLVLAVVLGLVFLVLVNKNSRPHITESPIPSTYVLASPDFYSDNPEKRQYSVRFHVAGIFNEILKHYIRLLGNDNWEFLEISHFTGYERIIVQRSYSGAEPKVSKENLLVQIDDTQVDGHTGVTLMHWLE